MTADKFVLGRAAHHFDHGIVAVCQKLTVRKKYTFGRVLEENAELCIRIPYGIGGIAVIALMIFSLFGNHAAQCR
ncbi:MAG: hypothetical protein A4E72_00125 [Syntrophus sp. PtaU1.Bin208]|nr:MAG: hypothetical protein A4E72_00125 [Syntrophus sp. PtaU1.Bin208]